jgi:hypothetical protein
MSLALTLPPDDEREVLRRILTIRHFDRRASARLPRRQDLRRHTLLNWRAGCRRRRLQRPRPWRPNHPGISRPRLLPHQDRKHMIGEFYGPRPHR